MSKPKKVTCPYCMEEFDNPVLEYERRKKKNSINPLAPPPKDLDVCRKCKHRIPKDYLYVKVRTLYVYFIGPKHVGKTRLIGNMITASEEAFPHRGILREWHVAPNPETNADVNKNGWREFYQHYAKDKNDQHVQATAEDNIDKFPMVLYKVGALGSMMRSFADMSFGKETVYLALADAMGEWFSFKELPSNTQDPLYGAPSTVRDEYGKRFEKADAIVLVLEPGHIPGLYEAGDIDKTETNLENILDYSQLLFGKRFQKIPLAITLTKFDRIFAAADNGNTVAKEFVKNFKASSPRNWADNTDFNYDDITTITAANKGIETAIRNIKAFSPRGRKNIEEIITSYPYASLFAVSSTGLGGLRNTEDELSPMHVLDPLVWILWQYGYLGSKLFK